MELLRKTNVIKISHLLFFAASIVLVQCKNTSNEGSPQSTESVDQIGFILADSLIDHIVEVHNNSIRVTTKDSFVLATTNFDDGKFGRKLYSTESFEIFFDSRWHQSDIDSRNEQNQLIKDRISFVGDSMRKAFGGRLINRKLMELNTMQCELSDKLLPSPVVHTNELSVFISQIKTKSFPELIDSRFYDEHSYFGNVAYNRSIQILKTLKTTD